jgi:hypothetical protein
VWAGNFFPPLTRRAIKLSPATRVWDTDKKSAKGMKSGKSGKGRRKIAAALGLAITAAWPSAISRQLSAISISFQLYAISRQLKKEEKLFKRIPHPSSPRLRRASPPSADLE